MRVRAPNLLVLSLLVMTLATMAPQRAVAQEACAQIAGACRAAGFAPGAARQGNGLQIDCVRPILEGRAQERRASKPLPQVDPGIVAACQGARGRATEAAPAPLPAAGAPPPVATLPSTPGAGKRPNIVFVLTDDLSWNLVQFMPRVVKMQKAGATFTNYFVTDSLCCPSRSSIFTGRYPHDTGVFRNVGDDGGYLAFRRRGNEQATFATALSAAGYRTAMLGKYLNGYLPRRHGVEPGWAFWAVAGNGYAEFNYDLNQDGKIVHYGDRPSDYLTDVLSGLAVDFIKRSAGKPFLIEVATFAPHAPYTPAPRNAEALPGLRAPRTPAFNAAPGADAPQWLKARRALSERDMAAIDEDFRKRAQSVLAVDAMIGALEAAVAAAGEGDNTYFIFSSDNGYHMGEHQLMPGKMTAFDSDIRVPLVVTGPGVPAGTVVNEIAENIDLCPTFAELAGMVPATSIDGRSLVPLLHRQNVADWRTSALVEHHGPVRNPRDPDLPGLRSGNPTTYEAIRAAKWVYVEYANGDKEYHDFDADADELRNTFSALAGARQSALHRALDAASRCAGVAACSIAERLDQSLTQR